MKKLLTLLIVGGLLGVITGCPSPSTGPTGGTKGPGEGKEMRPGKGKFNKDRGPGGESKEGRPDTAPPKDITPPKDDTKKDVPPPKDDTKKDVPPSKDDTKKDKK